jgi:endonuclease/exonuclease/phosphatase family metal-dependent hydrolase
MKRIYLIILSFILLSCGTPPDQFIKIGSWNVRFLSNNSRDDSEIYQIAKIISSVDIVAIQEARDTVVLDRIENLLPDWDKISSVPVGENNKEIYAYFWNTKKISIVGIPYIALDPDDLMIREPYVSMFSSGKFYFTLCSVHIIFGNSEKDREKELKAFYDLAMSMRYGYGPNCNIILLGDFNFSPDLDGWPFSGSWMSVFLAPEKTTIGDKSLYDNIVLDQDCLEEYTGKNGIIKFELFLISNSINL